MISKSMAKKQKQVLSFNLEILEQNLEKKYTNPQAWLYWLMEIDP